MSLDKALTAESNHLHLSLPLPPAGVFYPSDTLQPSIRFKGDRGYTSVSFKLVGETHATIMGKTRWQVGVMLNASTGGGNAQPVTSFERRAFVDQAIPLVPASSSSYPLEKGSHKGFSHSSSSTDNGVYEVTLPPVTEQELLPSLLQRATGPDGYDPVETEVHWRLELEGVRTGFLKSNDRLVLELPVAFPSQPWCHAFPNSVTIQKELKFAGSKESAPTVEANLTYQRPRTLGASVPFTLTLTPSSPSILPLLQTSQIKASPFITRQVRTEPILKPDNGQDFMWAAVRCSAGTMQRDSSEGGGSGGSIIWRGEVTPPAGEKTIDSRGICLKYALGVQLTSEIFASHNLRVSIPIFLPSSPVELPDDSLAPPEAGGSSLPAYQP